MAGAELPWREWIVRFYPHVASAPMAPRHERLWDWFEALERGSRPLPRVEVWPRGGAKSSTVELGTARVGAKLNRRFVLYVCETQDQANSHVTSIASLFEQVGVQAAVNQYGRARAWRRDQLQTVNGFNVAAFGLDAAQRGIKIDQYRPDLIIFDDIDGLHDSIYVTQKKVECITRTILPTGSMDCAILVVQNLIHANSIVSQLVDGRADFLLDRTTATVEPAAYDLEYQAFPREDGPPSYKVLSGRPTWEGQDLDKIEGQLNSWGEQGFLREAQHEVRVSGSIFFHEFKGIDAYGPGLHGEHVCYPKDVPAHYEFFGGMDDGSDNPFYFVLLCADEQGNVDAVDEIHARRLSPSQRAEAVKRLLQSHGLDSSRVLIAADPSMWNKPAQSEQIAKANIEYFWAEGLQVIKANNNRKIGHDNIREYLATPGGLEVYMGKCPALIKAFETGVFSRLRSEDLDDDADTPPQHMDPIAGIRYGLATRVRASKPPPRELTAEEIDAARAAQYAANMRRRLVGGQTDNGAMKL